MKKSLIIFMCGSYSMAYAQNAFVEKSIFGIQTGFLGVWINNESRLSNTIALRSEIGLDAGIWGGSYYDYTGFLMTPVLSLEPRYYYNLKRRNSKSKNIQNNAGDFISLNFDYHPDWFVISNYDNLKLVSNISIIPTWGIRRQLWKNVNYEAGLGIGYFYTFAKNAGYLDDDSGVAVNLLLRIGYTF